MEKGSLERGEAGGGWRNQRVDGWRQAWKYGGQGEEDF